jgi:NADPH-dependent 2,4-dienoyl-CoA reductase/sulfur reductase-like enzyme
MSTPMTVPTSVVIVGASAAGLSTAEALRRKGYQGRLTLLGEERHSPYDRPPLSKRLLAGEWEPERIFLRAAAALDELNADLVLGDRAVALDSAQRAVTTSSGRVLRGDVVVVATGLRARELPGQVGTEGAHVLRTLDDALSLRADLSTARRLVVVGSGVLGAEVAATARGLGLPVTLVGRGAPMSAQLGPLVAGVLADLHADRGVDLRLGHGVIAVDVRASRARGVRLDDGGLVPADVVVTTVGGTPATSWLEGSGLALDDGVVCDAHCRAADGVYAVGDVARWHHDSLGGLTRLENRTNAVEQGAAVAGDILGERRPYTPVPYFWTDQFDARIQVHGTPTADADVTVVEGDTARRRFVALYSRNGTVTGVLGWNMPKQARLYRGHLVEHASHDRAADGAIACSDLSVLHN